MHVHGLMCYETASSSELVVYNSCTRRSITLPKFKRSSIVKHFLGYDPVDGVYKVLCMTQPWSFSPMAVPSIVFQVLTLGNGNSWWKVIENSHTHSAVKTHRCINGVLYYEAYNDKEETAIVSFDVRSESFHLIKIPGDALSMIGSDVNMASYEGKLVIVSREIPRNDCIVLWVLEDTVKHEWSKKEYVLPHSWTRLAQGRSRSFHRLVDVTDAGEFLLAPFLLVDPVRVPHYVLYYDPEINRVRRVWIQGITKRKQLRQPMSHFHLFSSQVESLMFL